MGSTTKLTMKLLIDTRRSKVLYAEAGKEVVDFLFSILTLPVSAVIRLLANESMYGSIENLYKSFTGLGDAHLQQPNLSKDIILFTKLASPLSNVPLFFPDSVPEKVIYQCVHYDPRSESYGCTKARFIVNIADKNDNVCPECREPMTSQARCLDKQPSLDGLVKDQVTYMILDNLEVTPISTTSIISLLNFYQLRDVGALENKVVDLSLVEAKNLLKESFRSSSVLTDVFIARGVGV